MTAFRCLGLSALIAFAGCHMPTAAEREANRIASDKHWAEVAKQEAYNRKYDSCLYRVTGPFAAASYDVMKECERQDRAASGTSGSAQDRNGLDDE